jgi:aspartate/methionine/tyrosine aminotransferase
MPLEGIAQLRGWFAAQVGGGVGEADVIVCLGGQAALAACLRALAAPGAPVLVESPTYLGALAAARAAALDPVPVPTDADGVLPDQLARAFAATGARVFYCQPTYANPHGAVLTAARRAQVLEIARDAGAFVIEDDPFRDLALDGDPPPPLLHGDTAGHVVHVRSLTKSAAPGLRGCAVVARARRGAAAADAGRRGHTRAGRAPGGRARARHCAGLEAPPAAHAGGAARPARRADGRAANRSRRHARGRAAACTPGCLSRRTTTTSRSPPAPRGPACSSGPAGRTSRPSRPARSCA